MKKVIIGLLFLTICTAGCLPKNTVKLEYKCKQGEVLKHRIVLSNTFVLDVNLPAILVGVPAPVTPPIGTGTVTSSIGSTTIQPVSSLRYEISTHLELLCIKNIKNVTPDGIITIEERFEPLSEEILINKESTLLEGCSISDVLRDKVVTLKITVDGSILSTEGTDELLRDIYDRTSSLSMDATSRLMIGDALRHEMEQIIQQSITMFPGEKLTKGDIWKRQIIASLPVIGVKSTVTHTNSFEGFEAVNGYDCAKLAGSITSTISDEKPELSDLIGEMFADKITQQGFSTEMHVGGAEAGNTLTYFAHKEGKMIKEQIIKEGFINVTAPVMDGSSTMGEIKVKMTTNTKYIAEKYKE
ncbi:MAG: DUF6263 family protein [Candidatus Desantisbacteria bacterium]